MAWRTFTLKKTSGTTLSSGVQDSAVVYKVGNTDEVIIQLDGASWPGSLTIVVEQSLDGINFYPFPDGPVEFTALGTLQNLNMQGRPWMRLRVDHVAGSVTITPTARGKR